MIADSVLMFRWYFPEHRSGGLQRSLARLSFIQTFVFKHSSQSGPATEKLLFI